MNNASQIKQSFGPNAKKYAASPAFASGESLSRLLEVVRPRPDWIALDVATGGGHTALALSGRVKRVVAADLTPQMLIAARNMIAGRGVDTLSFCEADAQRLPFAPAAFDLVTCRIAPHHFPDVAQFVRECARAVKPGGTVAIIDGIAVGGGFTVRYLNAFETLRDPSHHWLYPARRWEAFFKEAGLHVTLVETFRKTHEFGDYCDRLNVSPADRLRLRAMLTQAPNGPKHAYDIFEKGGQLWFHLHEVLIVGAIQQSLSSVRSLNRSSPAI